MVVVMLHMQPVTSNCATLVPCREMMAAIPACPKSYLDVTGSLSTAIRFWSSETHQTWNCRNSIRASFILRTAYIASCILTSPCPLS